MKFFKDNEIYVVKDPPNTKKLHPDKTDRLLAMLQEDSITGRMFGAAVVTVLIEIVQESHTKRHGKRKFTPRFLGKIDVFERIIQYCDALVKQEAHIQDEFKENR